MLSYLQPVMLRRSFVVTLAGLFGCSTYISDTPALARLSGSTRVDVGYEHYVFFLATRTETNRKVEAAQQMTQLRKSFLEFAKSIGGKNLAIWANEANSQALSVELGKYFADRYCRWAGHSVEYDDGPYIILSDAHPSDRRLDLLGERTTKDPLVIAIGLRGLSVDRTLELIGYLEARLRREQVSGDARLGVAWIQLKAALDGFDLPREVKSVFIELWSRRSKQP